MAYDYSNLYANIDTWAQESAKNGWLEKQQLLSLAADSDGAASELFDTNLGRPLVVAFMGGTGVGKSSLLNKLAGKQIARAGVERPTSTEVTLYHHQQISIQQLGEIFPLQDIQISQHSDTLNEHVVWVDMPDFDSTEEKNKDIVMQWLPYVDVLIYVVSPERYKDNKAWQLLLAEGASHAWLFVMNQWDRGIEAQYDDFKLQLSKAGFNNPIIYKTISHPDFLLEPDDVPKLQQSIAALATENTIVHLENRGVQQRNNAIQKKLRSCLERLGLLQYFNGVEEQQESSWVTTKAVLSQGFEWPIQQLSVIYSKKGNVTSQTEVTLWDEWAKSRFGDYLDELVLNVNQQGLPNKPLRVALEGYSDKAEMHIKTQTELSCRKSLVNPGNVFHRIFLKIVKIAEVILPLLAMGLVGFQVFQGYYESAVTEQEFLGVDFAVHSSLLVLVSWLFPFFIRKKMQPSLEKAAFRGLNNGLEVGMQMIDGDIKQVILEYKQQHQEVVGSLAELIEGCDELVDVKSAGFENEQLERMLIS